MDIFAPANQPTNHRLELYTQHLIITGTVTSPFKRISDILNKGDTQFLKVEVARITPLGKQPAQKPVEGAVMVSLEHLQFVVEQLDKKPAAMQQGQPPADLEVRTAFVQKDHHACFAITGTYAVYGYCYLHPGASLESLLHGMDTFIPVTNASLYLVADSRSWSRDLVVINRNMISAMYLTS